MNDFSVEGMARKYSQMLSDSVNEHVSISYKLIFNSCDCSEETIERMKQIIQNTKLSGDSLW